VSSVAKASGSGLSKRRKSDIKWGYFFILPQLFGVLVFVLFPLVYVLVLSMLEWDGLGERTFVGLSNYVTEFGNPDFRNALKNTVYFTLMTVPTTVVLSLMAALALNKLRLKNFFRVIYFAPVVTSAVAAGVVWLWVYNPDFGLINTYLQTWFGIKGPQWLLNPKWVMPSIAIMSIWLGLGFNIVIFLAGLQSIPATFIEAAQIDGANRFQRFWYITLPLLSPTTFFIFIIAIINSFQVFDQAFILTFDGGPANSAVTMVYYLRELAFVDFVYGRSAAVAVILFAIILAFTLAQFRVQRRWVHYD
jgi:multiple sugar transport system permease protein